MCCNPEACRRLHYQAYAAHFRSAQGESQPLADTCSVAIRGTQEGLHKELQSGAMDIRGTL